MLSPVAGHWLNRCMNERFDALRGAGPPVKEALSEAPYNRWRSVVFPDCRGPVRTTAGNSLLAVWRTGSTERSIYGLPRPIGSNYAFIMHYSRKDPLLLTCSASRCAPAERHRGSARAAWDLPRRCPARRAPPQSRRPCSESASVAAWISSRQRRRTHSRSSGAIRPARCQS